MSLILQGYNTSGQFWYKQEKTSYLKLLKYAQLKTEMLFFKLTVALNGRMQVATKS